jgi:hypothetical protein
MPIPINGENPSICIRRDAFERAGLQRSALDQRFALTDDEFRAEGNLIVIGPLFGETVTEMLEYLETAGLAYFDDYFEWSGNWPGWISLYAMHSR